MAILLVAFVAFDIAALILWVPGTWMELLSIVLAICGIYGLTIAFISRSSGFMSTKALLEDLTSAHIFEYVAANFRFIALLSQLLHDSTDPEKLADYPLWHFPVAKPLVLIVFLLFIPFMAFYLIVVMGLAYIPMFLVSVFVDEIVYASKESVLEYKRDSEHERIWITGIVKGSPPAFKGFLLGIPAISVSFISAIISPFIA